MNKYVRKVLAPFCFTGLVFLTGGLKGQTWIEKANYGGGQRQYSAYFSINDKGYIGFGNNTMVNDMWEYDPTANTWTQKASIPGASGMSEMIGFTIGDVAYVGMGLSATLGTSSNFWKFDPVANTWTAVAPYPGAWTRGPAYFSIGTNGYVGSGSTDSSFYEYNSLTDTWTQKNDLPAGASRYYGISFAIGNYGYIGTGVKDGSVVFNDFWKYDPTTDTWTQIASLPGAARVNSVGFASSSYGYLVGGYNNNAFTFSDAYQYDPVTNSWTTEPGYAGGPRFAGAGFAIGCGAYYGTGTSYNGGSFIEYDDVWELTACTSLPLTIQTGQTNDSCYGNTNGSATATASGGTAPYHYSWQPGGQTTNTITGLAAGMYKVIVTDSLHDVDSTIVTITQPAAISVTASPGDTSVCAGSPVALNATGGGTYTWRPGAWLSDSTTASVTARPESGTTYTVTVNVAGCTGTGTVNITLRALPSAGTISASTSSICPGATVQLNLSGSTGEVQWQSSFTATNYQYVPAADTTFLNAQPSQTTYYRVVASAACGTDSSAPFMLAVNPLPDAGTITGPVAVCTGTPAQLSDSGSLSGLQWQASPDGIFFSVLPGDTLTGETFTGSQTAWYRVLASNTCGTDSSPAYQLVVNPLPVAGTITGPTGVCPGTPVQLSDNGGSGTAQWQSSPDGSSFAGMPADTLATNTVSAAQTTWYRVDASNACGTDSSQPFMLTVYPAPVPVLSSPDTTLCSGDSVAICTGGDFTSYYWNTGDTGRCTEVTSAGDYWVTVTDQNHCPGVSPQKTVNFYPVPSVSIIQQGDTLFSYGQVGYQWIRNNVPIDNATGTVYIARESGSYAVQVTDSNGCTTTSNPVVISGISGLPDEEWLLNIYPNPSVEGWRLTVDGSLVGSALEVYDDEGRLVFKSEIQNPKSEITAGRWPSGVYYVRISGLSINIVKQLIKL